MKLDSHGRVPYQHLTGDEWEVDVYDQRDGKSYLVPGGRRPAMVTLRRPFKAELPWRKR